MALSGGLLSLAAALLLAAAASPVVAGGVVVDPCNVTVATRKLLNLNCDKCAKDLVVIPQGQRCGGDRNGCCQKTNIGSFQDGYPSCANPNPYKKRKYCDTSIKAGNYWTPWDCNKFTCDADSICACNVGDCTCQSQQNFDNIKRNAPKGYSAAACSATKFKGPYSCQKQ